MAHQEGATTAVTQVTVFAYNATRSVVPTMQMDVYQYTVSRMPSSLHHSA